MEKNIRILFVDDFPLILKGFLSMIEEFDKDQKIEAVFKTNGDEALNEVKLSLEKAPFDIR